MPDGVFSCTMMVLKSTGISKAPQITLIKRLVLRFAPEAGNHHLMPLISVRTTRFTPKWVVQTPVTKLPKSLSKQADSLAQVSVSSLTIDGRWAICTNPGLPMIQKKRRIYS
jgi:hypothetical protein